MRKLLQIQTELRAPKANFNKFGGFAYRSAEDILDAVKPLLAAGGCLLTLSDEVVSIGDRTFLKAAAEFIDPSENFRRVISAFAEIAKEKKGMDPAQVTGSASSYARKYALGGLFLVGTEADPDALPPTAAATTPAAPVPAVPPPPPPPPVKR